MLLKLDLSLTGLRRLWRDVHLWIGVGLLVALIPIGLTGSLLAWREPIMRVTKPHRYDAADRPATLAPSAYWDAARRAMGPDAAPSELRFPQHAGEPVTINGQQTRRTPQGWIVWRGVWIDPQTAEVRDVGKLGSWTLDAASVLHGSLYLGRPGRQFVGWIGWALVISSATGLWLWWPRRGSVVEGLRWSRSTSLIYNLHHMAGFWIALPLSVVAVTGVCICFPATAVKVARVVLPPAAIDPPGRVMVLKPGPPEAGPPSIDTVASRGLALAPGGRLSLIRAPESPGADWTVELTGAEGKVTVWVGAVDGVARRAPIQAPWRSSLTVASQVHTGELGGLGWRTAVFLTGLAPPVLGVTGLIMWLRRRRLRT